MNIIFDLGNVLLNWNTDAIITSLNLKAEQEALLKRELFDHQDWLDLDKGITNEQQVSERIVNNTDLTNSIVQAALLAAKTSLHTIDETLELLDELHNAGHLIYCLSNMSVETYAAIKDKAFFSLFSGIVISGHEKCMKPELEIFEITLTRYELEPSQTLFIDDSVDNIQSAKGLGLYAHHFKRTKECYQQIRALVQHS